MAAYYSEFKPEAAAWLRELIRGGHIADGIVDERNILEVQPEDVREFTQCHFFAGIGGWSRAMRLAGWPDTQPVWTGSCPCQPFSIGGAQVGFDDPRHLWPIFHRLISQCGPKHVFGEQVASKLAFDWLEAVHRDCEDSGYAFGAACIPAACVGSNHVRDRLFWVAAHANSDNLRWQREWPDTPGPEAREFARLVEREFQGAVPSGRYGQINDAVSSRVAHLHGYGNAIVPAAAQAFIEAATGALGITEPEPWE